MIFTKERIKSFFKPNKAKITIFSIVLLYLSFLYTYSLFGPLSSPFPVLILYPLFLLGFLGTILFFPYSYAIACAIVALLGIMKKRKILLVVIILVSIFLFGIDEPLVNSTINRPDYSCASATDCVEKYVSKGGCGYIQCVNKKWEYYDSMINSVFATSCLHATLICSCAESRCQTKYINVYNATSLADCEKLERSLQSICMTSALRNMNPKIEDCEKIEGLAEKYACIEFAADEPSSNIHFSLEDCGKFEEYTKTDCILEIARYNLNVGIEDCEKVVEYDKDACMVIVVSRNTDFGLKNCGKLEENQKHPCIINMVSGNFDDCGKIEGFQRDSCIANIFSRKLNFVPEDCEKLKGEQKTLCLNNIISNNINTTVEDCGKIDMYQINYCVDNVISNNVNLNIMDCGKVPTGGQKFDCLSLILHNTTRHSIGIKDCEKLEGLEKSMCISLVESL